MLHETIQLHPYDATLITYAFPDTDDLHTDPRRTVVVCPGGGYSFLSSREGEPIVKQFLAAGFNVFMLRYSVKGKARNFQPLIEASLAIKHIRENAERYHTDPRHIYICGFSAGGHLAGSTGTLWNIPEVKAALGDAPEGINRPTGMILSYPVITGGEYAHRGSFDNLLGFKTTGTEPELDRFSLEKQVGPHTCPAFIWHTFTDRTVPVQNSLMMAEAMTAAKIPFELHIYPAGPHGLSTADRETWNENPAMDVPHVTTWLPLAIRWINNFDVE
ncbi:MAG: alpha/beta hydrolase [Clostridia bacterium]|nr:alpha/beta hydrolase [Clostridia bacterium]